jgi:hypothetical protein
VSAASHWSEITDHDQSPLTRQFLRVTKEVPAFGGITREHGGWVVSLLDPRQRKAAESRLRDIFKKESSSIAAHQRSTP